MQINETVEFIGRLGSLYENFHITTDLLNMWHNEMKMIEKTVLEEALRRYVVSGARENYPPTLNTLLTVCGDIRREQRQREIATERDERLPDVFLAAAERSREKNKAWAIAHVRMAMAFLNNTLTRDQAAAYCEIMSQKYPEDAEDWIREEDMYQ